MAKTLNRRARQLHEQVKVVVRAAEAERIAAARDRLLPPLGNHRFSPLLRQTFETLEKRHPHLALARQNGPESGAPNYSIVLDGAEGTRFFTSHHRDGQLVLVLNTDHPFYRRIYGPLSQIEGTPGQLLRQQFDLVLLAAARAEATNGKQAEGFLRLWSDVIATFLQS